MEDLKKNKLSQLYKYYWIFILLIISLVFVFSSFSLSDSFDENDNREIGYEFLDEGKVVHIWNTKDNYFFNKSSGIQLTNHYEDYWTRNIFCIGYYDGDEWIKIKCADELNNFEKSIETDNETYINATLWKDIEYGAYDLRLGVQYHLGLDDRTLSITIYGKNTGVDIPFDLGFAWKITDWEIPDRDTVGGDSIRINNTDYNLNGTFDLLFKNMTQTYVKDIINETTGEIIGNETIVEPIPTLRGFDYGKYLTIDWNENLSYAVKMVGNGNQEDFYVALLINAGKFNTSQEKSTTIYWIDAEGYERDIEDSYGHTCSSPNNIEKGWNENWDDYDIASCDDTSYSLFTNFTVYEKIWDMAGTAALTSKWYAYGTGGEADHYDVFCYNLSTSSWSNIGLLQGTDLNFVTENNTLTSHCFNPTGIRTAKIIIKYEATGNTEIGFIEDKIHADYFEDTTHPYFTSHLNNQTYPSKSENINLSINVNDNRDIDYIIFSTNDSGSWANHTFQPDATTSHFNYTTLNVQTAKNKRGFYAWFANDSNSNINRSQNGTDPYYFFRVQNAVPSVLTITWNDTTDVKTNHTVNCTIEALDVDVGDSMTFFYKFYDDGVTNGTIFKSLPELDLKTSGWDVGDVVACAGLSGDGTGNSTWKATSVNFTIANTAPSFTGNPTINETSPKTNDIINCTLTGTAYSDEDGDTADEFYFKWYEGGTLLYGIQTTANSTLDLGLPDLDKGDEIGCLVLANDGTDNSTSWLISTINATIGNTVPTISSAELNNTISVYTDTPVNCTLDFTDVDTGDTLTRYYKFYSNNVLINGIWENNATILTTYAGFDVGDILGCAGIVGDGTANATSWIASTTNATILNSPPTMSTAIINNTTPYTNDPVNCSVTATDADADTFTFYYKWYNSSITNSSVFTSPILDLSTSNWNRDNTIGCLALVNDGTTNSSWFTSTTNGTIQNSIPAINVDTTFVNTTNNHSMITWADFSDADGDADMTECKIFIQNTTGWASESPSINNGNCTTLLDYDVDGYIPNVDLGITIQVYDKDDYKNSTATNNTLVNHLPTMSTAIINNTTPYTNDPVNCSVTATDADADTFTFYYKWYNSSITNGSIFTSPILDLSTPNWDVSNTVGCLALVNDGYGNSSWFTSTTNGTIQNSNPIIYDIDLCKGTTCSSPPIESIDALNCSINSTDVDVQTLKINVTWFYNATGSWHKNKTENNIIVYEPSVDNEKSWVYVPSGIPSSYTSTDEKWVCQALAWDNYTTTGTKYLNSSVVTIGDTTAPTIDQAILNFTSRYTDEYNQIFIRTIDVGSSIEDVIVEIDRPAPLANENISMTLVSGDNYTTGQFNYATLGDYNATKFYAHDSSSNWNSTRIANLTWIVSTRPVTPPGGGGAPEPPLKKIGEACTNHSDCASNWCNLYDIIEELRGYCVTDLCGDGRCQVEYGENILSCPEDCMLARALLKQVSLFVQIAFFLVIALSGLLLITKPKKKRRKKEKV